MTALNELEREVLLRLTAGSGPDFECLRVQVEQLHVHARTETGVGFRVDFAHPPMAAAISNCESGTLGTLHAECEGVKQGLGFIAFLRRGRLTQLECFSHAGEPVGALDVSSCQFEQGPGELRRADHVPAKLS